MSDSLEKMSTYLNLENEQSKLFRRLVSKFSADEVERLRANISVIIKSNSRIVKTFTDKLPEALKKLDANELNNWTLELINNIENMGEKKSIEVIENLNDFVDSHLNKNISCNFEDASTFIRHFVRGLGGRDLKIASYDDTFTDTESLYLPDSLHYFPVAEKNFSLYKLTAVHLWAQTNYGTWKKSTVDYLLRNPDKFRLAIFNRLECIRLDKQLSRDLPGIWRQLTTIKRTEAESINLWKNWTEKASRLCDKSATSADSFELIDKFSGEDILPPLEPYQSEMQIHKVIEALSERIEKEKEEFKKSLEEFLDSEEKLIQEDSEGNLQSPEIELVENADGDSEDMQFQLSLNGEVHNLPDHLQDLVNSIMQDLGEIPEEYLKPNEKGEYADSLTDQSDNPNNLALDSDDTDSFLYDEWDCTRNRFKRNYCTLRELDIPLGESEFISETLEKYSGILKSIKKTFEAIIGENRIFRRQIEGDGVDLDAVVDSFADLVIGREPSEYVYTRYRNQERNIAVMFMIDMSGSTLGWVNEAERESLVLLCEALELLGDRYAIYGFSGRTNKRCEVYKIKEFAERYLDEVKQRISGIRPKAYTRMGVAIRHLGHLLNSTNAKTKLLITLSDGRPEDYGGYKGKYGIEDTRHALLELKQTGIHSFCITIDTEAQEYLPYMYGKVNYAVIDEVAKLPHKVADIYRKLTT